jgi:hypothetical protein
MDGCLTDYEIELVELLDLDDYVLAEVRIHGRGKESGLTVTVSQVDLYRVSEELIMEQRAGCFGLTSLAFVLAAPAPTSAWAKAGAPSSSRRLTLSRPQ